MKNLKVLHVASFQGNIGDNANHSGVRKLLRKNLDFTLEFTNSEIRELYWGSFKFDDTFADIANKHDLVIIGGGNYFELWVDKSCTGTTLDINKDVLKAIKTPILFNGLGCDVEKGTNEENINKFKNFLDYVLGDPGYLVSVRNDGSFRTIENYIGKEYASQIYRIPDGGFFTEVGDYYHPELPKDDNSNVLGISLAGDMLDIRFSSPSHPEKISYIEFLDTFSNLLNKILAEDRSLRLVFFPHIFRDLDIIYNVLERVEDRYRRTRITVAPYLQGAGSQEYIFDLYRRCNLILGMRFHANVCPIGLNVPTIGLITYPKIRYLYNELGMNERAILADHPGFGTLLLEKISETILNKQQIQQDYSALNAKLLTEVNEFHSVVNNWLKQHVD